jgi:hypothetical protein
MLICMASLYRQLERRGFSKWYEWQLIQSHLHLITAILAGIAVVSGLELFFETQMGYAPRAMGAAVTAAGIVVCGFCVRRYITTLFGTEEIANQAVCPQCGTYARFKPVHERGSLCVDVQCHKCQRQWRISSHYPRYQPEDQTE